MEKLATDHLVKFHKDEGSGKVTSISKRCNDEKGEGEEAASFGIQYG